MQAWHTLLELKDEGTTLGFKGEKFFIYDFPLDLERDELMYAIAQPTFTGVGVGTGTTTFVLTDEKLNELFDVVDETFNEYAKKLKDEYLDSRS